MIYRDMDRKDISLDVDKTSCRFIQRKKTLDVLCAWTGYNVIPLLDKTISQDFSFEVFAEMDGEIEIY